MIKDIKMGFQLLKYAYSTKSLYFIVVIYFLIGITMLVLLPEGNAMLPIFLMMGGVCVSQLLFSVAFSDMVQTSPHKKRIETIIINLMGGLNYIFADIVLIILVLVKYGLNTETESSSVFLMLIAGIEVVAICIYMSGALKLFEVFTLLFAAAIAMMGFFIRVLQPVVSLLTLPTAIIINIFMIVAGIAISCGLSAVLYKLPISKRSQIKGLKKSL